MRKGDETNAVRNVLENKHYLALRGSAPSYKSTIAKSGVIIMLACPTESRTNDLLCPCPGQRNQRVRRRFPSPA